ncbi:Integrin alpha-8 [Thelohanellus kitauei]|uniref:Integrin alpha-8 n=1 Tax=Thelohanellus kitauei TaxID=669202 RepID=A0A0C2IXK6_THEKT|nr:Integrin alpha-8 [Thelohanellus kitauei]
MDQFVNISAFQRVGTKCKSWTDCAVLIHRESRLFLCTRNNSYFSKFQPIQGLYGENKSSCLFGYSMTLLNDMNHDGIDELVVSAPFCSVSQGGGAIYIYLSSKDFGYRNGHFDKLMSVNGVPQTFFGIKVVGFRAKRADDRYGHDSSAGLIVSSPDGNEIYVLRTNPVISVAHKVAFEKNINKHHICSKESPGSNLSCSQVLICLSLFYQPGTGESFDGAEDTKYDFQLHLYGDERAVLLGNPLISAEPQKTICKYIQIGFYQPFKNYLNPIDLNLTYSILEDDTERDIPYFAFLNEPRVDISFYYEKRCIDVNACRPDLMLAPIDPFDKFVNYSFRSAQQMQDGTNFSFGIQSHGEPGYDPELVITVPTDIKIIKILFNGIQAVDVNHTENQGVEMLSVSIPNELNHNVSIRVTVTFSIKQLHKPSLWAHLLVKCAYGTQMTNNVLNISIVPRFESSFEVGSWMEPNETSLVVNPMNLTISQRIPINLHITINNHGPSFARNVPLSIFFPYKAKGQQILGLAGLELSESGNCQYDVSEVTNSHKAENESSAHLNLIYGQIECLIYTINDQPVNLSVEFMTMKNASNLLENITGIPLNFLVIFNEMNFSYFKTITKSNDSNVTQVSPEVPWWLIILVSGIFLLLIACIPLFKYAKRRFNRKLRQSTIKSYKQVLASANF